MYTILALVGSFIFLYSLLSPRLDRSLISGPMLAVILGSVCGPVVFELMEFEIGTEPLRLLAELALALVLFTDAAHTNLRVLENNLGIPLRLLSIGLPLTLLLGFLMGWLLFPWINLVELGILAAILAPTDAALGKPVVVNEKVPSRIREGLKVESGLNDGIAVPVLFLLIALLSMSETEVSAQFAFSLFAKEIGIGLLAGVAVTYLGDQVIDYAQKQGWITLSWKPIVIIALVISLFGITQLLEGSGFIASFVGGIMYGKMNKDKEEKKELLESAEGTGDSLGLVTWFIFGMMALIQIVQAFSWQIVLYALLSLTVIRILPVFISLLNSSESLPEKLFMGWFGPRGLASVVFVLIIMDHSLPGADTIIATVSLTILLSIFAHGFSAIPLINRLYPSAPEEIAK